MAGKDFFSPLEDNMQLKEPDEIVSRKSVIRKELAKIKEQHPEGLLTAEATVEAATPEESPIHNEFEWDDSAAAHQHRLAQARALIRVVRVINPEDAQQRPVPRYVSLMPDRMRDGGGYRETSDVIEDDELRQQLEETARRELEAWLRRNAILTDLCQAVKTAAEGTKAKAKKRRRRVVA